MRETITISVQFIKKLFCSDDNFAIFITNEKYSAKGYIIDDPINLLDVELELNGYFQKSDKYGETFIFSSYKQKSSNYYFLKNMVKGINEKIAKDMVDTFGDRLYEVIENTPNDLLQVKGIGKAKLKQILISYEQMSHTKKLAEFLSSFDISNTIILNIYNHFGEDGLDVIKNNPYELTHIRGMGFKKADSIALKIGKEPSDISRIENGILYTFNQYINLQGSTCMNNNLLYKEASLILEIQDVFSLDKNIFQEALDELINRNVVIQEKDFFILKEMYDMERYIIDTINTYSGGIESILKTQELDTMIDKVQKEMDISLSDEQKEAIVLANNQYQIFSLCGYAGTGKSTISKIILQLMSNIYPRELIVCCSLSGVASSRIKQLTSFDAFTIHSLLRFKGHSFEFNENNKLPHRVILLDEASMVNVPIFYALLKAINFQRDAILILVGDIAQLPPIGAGDVYFDIISQNLSTSKMLQHIYRQENQVIKLFASFIRQGKIPPEYKKKYDDFIFIDIPPSYEQSEQTLQSILDVIREYKDMKYLYTKENIIRYISYFQIISPVKNQILGVKNLNKYAQDILNANPKIKIEILSYDFRIKDKVIHLKNKNMPIFTPQEFKEINLNNIDSLSMVKEKRIFNGQRGVISHIDIKNKYIFVFYPIEEYIVWYKIDDIKENILDLCYAMSGHKTQGSEFENVLIPVSFSHYIMLHTRLMYTMITRVKKKLILIGDVKAFESACTKIESKNRDTLIKSIKS
jgi:exodeoxyribonuclease V alpha subunit